MDDLTWEEFDRAMDNDIIDAQAREIAELKADLEIKTTAMDLMSNCGLMSQLEAKLVDQAQLLAEARRLINMFVRCDMDCTLEGSNCTDPSGHWSDCSLHQVHAFLAKLPK